MKCYVMLYNVMAFVWSKKQISNKTFKCLNVGKTTLKLLYIAKTLTLKNNCKKTKQIYSFQLKQ